ncbi:MAG: hypothetical protein V1888_03105 [archaeon]
MKSWFYLFNKKMSLFLMSLFLISGFVFAYSQAIPNPGHGADSVFISINGNKVDLQTAINNGMFSGDYAGNGNYGSVDLGHSDNVFVNVGGVNKNLQSVIDDGSLCSSGNGGSGQYSGDNNKGHDASKIWVNFNGEKTLQQAINEGLFGNNVWSPATNTKCSGQAFTQSKCGATQTAYGTDTTGACCTVSSWGPDPNTVCYGQWFTQTSNCGTTKSVQGTKTGCNCIATYTAKFGPGYTSTPAKSYDWCIVGTQQYVTHWVSGGYLYVNCSESGVMKSDGFCWSLLGIRDGSESFTACVDSSWSPASSTKCAGTWFEQTSNCGTIQGVQGTKDCVDIYGAIGMYSYNGCGAVAPDSCNGDTWNWYTCAATDNKVCTDSKESGWVNGDWHCYYRSVTCKG